METCVQYDDCVDQYVVRHSLALCSTIDHCHECNMQTNKQTNTIYQPSHCPEQVPARAAQLSADRDRAAPASSGAGRQVPLYGLRWTSSDTGVVLVSYRPSPLVR
jgi:hypothetical protein